VIDATSKERLAAHLSQAHGSTHPADTPKAVLSLEHGLLECSWRVTRGIDRPRSVRNRWRQVQWRRAWSREAEKRHKARESKADA
jgi:hypothetical protein